MSVKFYIRELPTSVLTCCNSVFSSFIKLLYNIFFKTLDEVLPPTTPPPTIPPPTTPPPTPPAVTILGPATSTSVVVSWSQQPSVDSYEISFHRATGNQQLGDCSSLEHSGNVSVSGSITMYNVTGLQEFSTYVITITAVNGAGRSRSDPLRVSTEMAGMQHKIANQDFDMS